MGTAEKTISYVYGEDDNAGWKNILTRYNGEDIVYDAIGNPVSYRGADLTWDGRELKKYKIGNDFVVEYTYDADGLRASKTVNGEKTTYQYIDGKLMYEDRNGEDLYYFYDSNGVISGIRYFDANGNMTMIYVVTNAQGDVIALYDKNGNAVVEYQYDAWGNIVSVTNSTENAELDWNEINPFRYRGYYYDSETDLYYLQSRYYDAETGRFINADSRISAVGGTIQGNNMFTYGFNNHINMIDITGSWPTWNDIKNGINKAAEWVNDNVIEPAVEFVKDAYITINDACIRQGNMELEMAVTQQKMVKGTLNYVADCYYQGLQMQSASQRQAAEPVADFIIDRFSTREKSAKTFGGMAIALGGIAIATGEMGLKKTTVVVAILAIVAEAIEWILTC